jgi:hypothetical protein
VFEAVLALVKSLPWLKDQVDAFIAWYLERELEGMKAENAAAILKCSRDKDQRDLEKAIGNSNPGVPSGIGVIRNDLPGLPHPPADPS